MSRPRIVRASLWCAQPLPAGATLHVLVEDTSRADAAAPVVAEVVQPLDRPMAVGERLDVAVTVPRVEERTHYNVRVHLDRSGSGDVTAGDAITTRAYPVLTFGAGEHVDVELVEI